MYKLGAEKGCEIAKEIIQNRRNLLETQSICRLSEINVSYENETEDN